MSNKKGADRPLFQSLKRNAVVAAVVLFVCVAVYLNWNYTQTGKTLGQATLVAGESQDPLVAVEQSGQQQPVEGQEQTSSAYFANARLNRQQARDKALTMLQETLTDEGATEAVKEQTGAAIETMAGLTMTESRIENLILAKGYVDCVVYIGQDSASVVVQGTGGELTQTDTARIVDVVAQNTQFDARRIKIIPVE